MPQPYPLNKEHQHHTYGTVPLTGKPPRYHVAPRYRPLLRVIDMLGKPIGFFLKKKQKPTHPKKILVIRLDHLGDVIMTLPTYAALKKLHPKAELHTLVRSFTKDLFYNNKHVDKIIFLDPPWFVRDKKNGWLTTLKTLFKLRKEKYDIIIDLHADPRNILVARIIRGYTTGYDIRGLGFLLNKTTPHPGFKHLLHTNHHLVQSLGYTDNTPLDALKLSNSKEAEKNIQKLTTKPYIILNPISGQPSKNWITERWAEIGNKLAAKGYTIYLTGSSADKQECENIIHLMKQPATNLAGTTTISELIVLTKKAKLVISPDSAIMHISACLGTPSITLFGPIPPALCAYNDKKHRIIVKPLPCSHCAQHTCPRKDKPNECMTLITPQDIMTQAEELLAQ